MIRLLRLFPAFRRLESQLREEAGHRIAQDDKIRALTAQLTVLEGKELAAKNETIDATKRIADFIALSTTGRKVFNTEVQAGEILPQAEPTARATSSMRQYVNQQIEEFRKPKPQVETELEDFYAAV